MLWRYERSLKSQIVRVNAEKLGQVLLESIVVLVSDKVHFRVTWSKIGRILIEDNCLTSLIHLSPSHINVSESRIKFNEPVWLD